MLDTAEINSTYETVIGLELHIQLNTTTKAFCRDENKFAHEANKHISATSLAYPGTLPYLNKKHVEKAIKLGLVLHCEINKASYFERKNYFYPDLSKGFQTTQDKSPICIGGYYELNEERTIRLNRIHMEEDAGKSIHDASSDVTKVDYNRAGSPLLELVTEPDFRSAEEVSDFILAMRKLVRYLEISDGNMQEGSLRCDINVSLRPKGTTTYGTRCEIKNINSATHARHAIATEVARQLQHIKGGKEIEQATLDYNHNTKKLRIMRTKENAHDYRYFPEPDIPIVHISDKEIEDLKQDIGLLPAQMETLLRDKYGLKDYDIKLLADQKNVAELYMKLANAGDISPQLVASFVINHMLPAIKTSGYALQPYPIKNESILALLNLIEKDGVHSTIAYQKLLPELLQQPDVDAKELAGTLGLLEKASNQEIERLIDGVLQAHPEEVAKYKSGKKNLIGFFMGKLMKEGKGKFNPTQLKEGLETALKQ